MKKQEIKRRKRVAPAAPGDGSTQATSSVASHSPQQRAAQTPVFESSVSPDPSTAIETSEDYPPEPRGPLAIDFTNYQSSASLGTSSQLSATTPHGAPSPRKRSRSATMESEAEGASAAPDSTIPHRTNPISSILNHPPTQDRNIDPALSNAARPPGGASPGYASGGPTPSPTATAARKEWLKRETELIKQELARRQKELEELESLED